MTIRAIETMPDHMHILDAPPQINLADFINAFKSASSRKIRQQFAEQLKPYYWKPYFWSLSYFVGSVSKKLHLP
ncbi:MAG: IS200/IS605 family transposase [Solobacterium sp.]|nr:IS200/IS605 family transposase [Solobacterium sp.]